MFPRPLVTAVGDALVLCVSETTMPNGASCSGLDTPVDGALVERGWGRAPLARDAASAGGSSALDRFTKTCSSVCVCVQRK